jgi:hypothetical protein
VKRYVEAISKIEKLFEVKPPAPLPARRVGPTPRRGQRSMVKNPDHRPGILLSRLAERDFQPDGRTHRDRAIWHF